MLAAAIDAALAAGRQAHGLTSPNPPVGCALIDDHGALIAVGSTRPAGGHHAEIVALRHAGERARGATAVVTLEPCNHTGRTGPCAQALIDAGIAAVYYLQPDPNPAASGGAQHLRDAGITVGRIHRRVPELEAWLRATRLGRPHVTVKFAQSLDGYTAAVDGTSQWITSTVSRRDTHRDRLRRDAIIVGTSTALADNPSLNARAVDGTPFPEERQPRRVVIGSRDVRGAARNLTRLGFEQYATIDEALAALYADGARDVLVEGGATLAGSFLRAGLVDALRVYLAPVLLGSGASTVGGGLARTLAEAERFELVGQCRLGDDMRLNYARR
ncbi:bifunctional diaminohydroxyphosphoribosylaminopyrimidine deaminase/5-amino-6-(5-phosphoribosylamino)uracil reductase RibD [Corynebacterium yudongzhengii]|uniref:Riboflavin biosynthesis protein RibD n=1 Tax=Corynebacterium yudongzhengii TaxID=2080740 RepID=A0A2U1T8A2_9CORY|nr:bifunctional diaminohydroxyphosphoribosylaminopyrimidine deaminase/5-amino-6-(5-phosphoribosylamino)uracil reductase RibD [Corynebacterium yudongzhengii]AWB81844.1 bifunctional diaminohydroxyphosphoribosylaminopyrimidine deaminase/5-amino-6-(5-phosphoribosylamino)uracil reductase RibD [Corynebacterium yudongzhengii]PWC02237.1 bifunctional diaminohydroxyphosphoribosylaminopyrimidine deaminase/5-amino-6-(5-phosphoribosylamino)uracil reductase RibD [Corynebacterium yudongzhengii]